MSVLASVIEGNEVLRCQAESLVAASSVAKLIQNVDGQDRVNAQRLKVMLPNRKEEIETLIRDSQSDEFYLDCGTQLDNGIVTSPVLYTMCHLTLCSPSRYFFCTVAAIISKKPIIGELELELFYVLAIVEASFPEQTLIVISKLKEIQYGSPDRSKNATQLLAVIDFMGIVLLYVVFLLFVTKIILQTLTLMN